MEPAYVAGHVMLTDLHNDVYMEGVYKSGAGTAVQVFLRNGYGISLATSDYGGDTLPLVAPIVKDPTSETGWTHAWDKHPDFSDIMDSQRGCDVERAREILAHLKGVKA